MAGRNRNDRSDTQSYNRNAGYEQRFGSAGMKGAHRFGEFEPETYGAPHRFGDEPINPRRPAHGDYSTFEGTTNRPYYGGEEGSFPYGGPSFENQRRPAYQASYNADERDFSNRWSGQHAGKGPKGYRRSDERIREEVCEVLTEHGDIDASEIEVSVKDAVVDLTGTVESRRIKRLAEDIVERVNGVRDVRNDLHIMSLGISSEQVSDMNRNAKADRAMDESSPQGSPNAGRSAVKDRSSRSKGTKIASSRQISQ